MKKLIAVFLLLLLCVSMTGCGGSDSASDKVTKIGFSDAVSVDTIKSLDGKTVSINGYMATLSPISGKYIYLMNMPYQSCPFCVPNTTQLSNTIAMYAPDGKTFDFTDSAVTVKGTIRVEDYTDEYGYNYNYRIVNATVETLDLAAVSDEYALWQSIAEDGIVGDINSMFDYLHFICCWPDYTMQYTDESGAAVYLNLYDGDVAQYLADDSVYGYASYRAEGYFPSLIDRVNAISAAELTDLVEIINAAKEVETYAITEFESGHYTFDEANDRFILTNADDLYNRWLEVYTAFSQWLAKWQM